MNMEEPPGSPEGSLDEWLVTGMWYLVGSLLASWDQPRNWPEITDASNKIEKALRLVGKTPEQPSACEATGAMAGCFFQLCALRQRPSFMT